MPDEPVQNSLQQGPAPQGAPQGGPQGAPPPPPPSHAQTVAALRHFDAIKGELHKLLKDPELGKSDLKAKIIDGMTILVSNRMVPATQAVTQLASVPSDPIKQRQWASALMQQTTQAENVILDHYGQGNPSLGDVHGHVAGMDHGSGDDHLNHMAALHTNYSRGR